MKNKYLSFLAFGFALILVGVLVWRLGKNVETKPGLITDSSKMGNMNVAPVSDEQNTVESESELVAGFPNVPVYKGLELRRSSKRINPAYSSGDFYAKWVTTNSTVTEMEKWYEQQLITMGWQIQAPNDKSATSEQIIHMSKGKLSGFVGIEIEEDAVEVVIDLQQNK